MKHIYLISILFFLSDKLLSQPGSLDPSFGDQGKILETMPNYPSPIYSVITKSNGSILVGTGIGSEFIIKQFLNDGTPDSTFGENGDAEAIFNKQFGTVPYSIGLTSNNEIIAAGYSFNFIENSHYTDILLAKYFENGELDLNFGDSGRVAFDFGIDEFVNCMKVLDNGNILVAGSCTQHPSSKANFFLAEFSADGSVNTNFGNGGKVITDVGASYQSYINAIAIDPDGNIIVVGNALYIPDFQQSQFLVAKYTANGKLSTEFGDHGIVFTSVSPNANYAYAVGLQTDNKIVVAGSANYGAQGPSAMAIVRYNNNGTIDTSFNGTGSLSIFFGSDNAQARSLVIRSSGDFLLGGIKYPQLSSPPDYAAYDFGLTAVTANGKIDSTFGTNGVVTTDFSDLDDQCYALALQQDGKIVAAGGSTDNTNNITYIALARYNGFLTQKQIIITKIHRWIQHHNGFTWDANNNISNYVVQRSYDGIHFSSIARVNANNNSALTYEDPTPLNGTNYYRLQTTSINGAVNYSNVLAVTNTDIKISPNPATNSLHIEGLSLTQKTKLTVVDIMGGIKLQSVINAASCNLNVASLKPGNYLLKIEINNEVVTKQFVKE